MELDEEVSKDLQSLKKTIARYFKKEHGWKMRSVFVETSLEIDISRGLHMLIDAVGVPSGGDDFDLEVIFQKALLEGDSEWEKSNSRKIIDTIAKRGDVQKCLPLKGKFSFTHVDFDGLGGMAHIIEDSAKFGKYKALGTLASGPLGLVMYNIKSSMKREKANSFVKELKQKFSDFLDSEKT